jgi:putative transposase
MPRRARLVVPGYAHHVTQRGIRGLKTFFRAADYSLYLELFRERLRESKLTVCAYCLMPNHIHAVVIPTDASGLARHFRTLHSSYAKYINASHGWKGHLWQERFYSAVMDEAHTLSALRYVEMNPVRAGLCDEPDQWRWSSVHANLGAQPDGITDTDVTRKIVPDWRSYLNTPDTAHALDRIRSRTRNGRPAGGDEFVDQLEASTGLVIRPKPRRRKHPN